MTFLRVNFVNVKINCMIVEYNNVSLIGGNCKEIPILQMVKCYIFVFVTLSVLWQAKCNLPWLFVNKDELNICPYVYN
jgi:hypothetical protein